MITHRLRSAVPKFPTPSFNLVATSTSNIVPAETQIGDIIILSSFSTNSGLTAPTNSVPAGWTQVTTQTGGYSLPSYPPVYFSSRQTIIYKIADSNGSFTISTSSIVFGSYDSGINILVLRPITGSVTNVVVNVTTGNTIDTSGATGKVIAIADFLPQYGGSTATLNYYPLLSRVAVSNEYLHYWSTLTGGVVWTVNQPAVPPSWLRGLPPACRSSRHR